jgi:hypothetical protein
LLQDLGKKSFRSLKKQWKEVKDVEAAIKADKNEKTHRRMMRRQRVSGFP